MKKAILLISHGSYAHMARAEVVYLAKELKRKAKVKIFEYAFLEINRPTIPEGLEICISKGATTILILQNFLNSGKHTARDIPRFIGKVQKKFPKVRFLLTQPIGQHSQIPALFLSLIQKSKH